MKIKKHIGIERFLEKNDFYNTQYVVMKTIVVCSPLRFYTQIDEENFFRWIKKIKSINKAEGIGKKLNLIIKSNKIPNKDLLELIGFFRRYNFDLKRLNVFMNHDNHMIFQSLQSLNS